MLLLSIAPLYAQNAVSQETYGAGVHAYFSGDFRHAHQLLTSLIDTSANDPRAYYFRGLALMHLGREDEAKQDFLQGAKLETKDLDQTHNVSKALERIQGDARVLLEQYRAEARLLAFQRSEQFRKERYEAIRREEDRVLQQQSEGVPTPKPIPPPPGPAPTDGAGVKPAPAPVEKQPPEPPPVPAPVGKKPAPAAPEENPFEATKAAPAGPSGTGILPVVPQATGGTPVPPAGPAKPGAPGDDAIGWAIGALGIKTPAGAGAPAPATPPAKTPPAKTTPAVAAPGGTGILPVLPAGTGATPVPPPEKAPTPAKKVAGGVAAPDDSDLFAPATAGGAKPGAGKAAAPDAAGAAKTPADDETNPFLEPGGSAAKGKSAAKKPGSTAKSATGKKPAAKAAKAPADDADSGSPFESPADSGAGKKTGN
jgi:hypothetical protein